MWVVQLLGFVPSKSDDLLIGVELVGEQLLGDAAWPRRSRGYQMALPDHVRVGGEVHATVHGIRLRDEGRVVPQPLRPRQAVAARSGSRARRTGDGGMDFASNTNVIGHAGRTFAIVEAGGNPYELTERRWTTIGRVRLRRTKPGGYTAHPSAIRRTG